MSSCMSLLCTYLECHDEVDTASSTMRLILTGHRVGRLFIRKHMMCLMVCIYIHVNVLQFVYTQRPIECGSTEEKEKCMDYVT